MVLQHMKLKQNRHHEEASYLRADFFLKKIVTEWAAAASSSILPAGAGQIGYAGESCNGTVRYRAKLL